VSFGDEEGQWPEKKCEVLAQKTKKRRIASRLLLLNTLRSWLRLLLWLLA
jgi:hypothetical protein